MINKTNSVKFNELSTETFVTILLLVNYVTLGVIGFVTVRLWVEVKAMLKSTHSVQYIDPLASEQFKKALEKEVKDDPFETLVDR